MRKLRKMLTLAKKIPLCLSLNKSCFPNVSYLVYRVLFQEHGARVDVTDNDGVILGSFGAFYPKLGSKYVSGSNCNKNQILRFLILMIRVANYICLIFECSHSIIQLFITNPYVTHCTFYIGNEQKHKFNCTDI